jgi:hypothetical protein
MSDIDFPNIVWSKKWSKDIPKCFLPLYDDDCNPICPLCRSKMNREITEEMVKGFYDYQPIYNYDFYCSNEDCNYEILQVWEYDIDIYNTYCTKIEKETEEMELEINKIIFPNKDDYDRKQIKDWIMENLVPIYNQEIRNPYGYTLRERWHPQNKHYAIKEVLIKLRNLKIKTSTSNSKLLKKLIKKGVIEDLKVISYKKLAYSWEKHIEHEKCYCKKEYYFLSETFANDVTVLQLVCKKCSKYVCIGG